MSGSSASSLRLGPAAKLRQSWHFARIKASGKRVASGCLVANWGERAPGEVSRLGVVTSKRIGSAVVRSRARRLLREAFRRNRNGFAYPIDLVLVARKSMNGMMLQDVERDVILALKRGGVLRSSE